MRSISREYKEKINQYYHGILSQVLPQNLHHILTSCNIYSVHSRQNDILDISEFPALGGVRMTDPYLSLLTLHYPYLFS
ncbi:hypothetical protein RCL_jg4987.t1 [Rhizophagus clarus]|uniref:Uncharacterized protein n=1 Tax=Rhizophagus clarus TaxID=94130 RepID=A0A8H3L8T5_9GLOM|nr:hypothetical protein RCL_jg4987.t1 [Rhizophagus clarus]